MRARLIRTVAEVRSSFWFVPTLMAVAAVLLSRFTLALDQRGTEDWLGELTFIYLNQAGGARDLLSTIAGSMMNVAGVVFSLTIVALTLASQQFGPRLMGNFMRDRGNQVVLGTFIATFLYCLLILRTVQAEGPDEAFVPHLSIAVALLITLAALAATIYFIHHIAASIQVPNVIGKVTTSLAKTMSDEGRSAIFPAGSGQPASSDAPLPDTGWGRVLSDRSGYLQAIDGQALVESASEHDVVVRLLHRPGAFLLPGQELAEVHPAEQVAEVSERLRKALSYSRAQSGINDPATLLDQLLELAGRSLSPAASDAITANACLDRVAESLTKLGDLELPVPARSDEEGRLRLVVPPLVPADLLHHHFSSLRSSLAANLLAARHSLDLLRLIARVTSDARLAAAANDEADALLSVCRDSMSEADYQTLSYGARRAGN